MVVYRKKMMMPMVYMGMMTPIVPPPFGWLGCMPGPPMVGLMPGMGPPLPAHSLSIVLIGGIFAPFIGRPGMGIPFSPGTGI